eukprot:43229-Eustigmatos_ZCMA.PRE.1
MRRRTRRSCCPSDSAAVKGATNSTATATYTWAGTVSPTAYWLMKLSRYLRASGRQNLSRVTTSSKAACR